MLAILPLVAKRSEEPDKLPGLYFYGPPQTGKSYFFNLSEAYHKVAVDAPGVSRFKLQRNEDALFLDDIQSGTLDNRNNSSTVRQLALGDTASVKICGGTQTIRAFVVCTGNDTPNFLKTAGSECYDAEDRNSNCKAWQRRFITIKLSNPVDMDPIHVDLRLKSAQQTFKKSFLMFYDKLTNEAVKEMFSKYKKYIAQ